MTWGYYWCPHCNEQKKSNNDLFQYDGDTETRCCKKVECSRKEKQTGIKRVREHISSLMNDGDEITVDIESLDFLTAEEKQIIRDYNINYTKKQEIKREQQRQNDPQTLRTALLETQEVKEAEGKIGLSCWSRSDSSVPVSGTCEKCQSSNQVIFEPKYKKVNPLGSSPFTNYLCVDCCCEEKGIKPKSSSPKRAKCDNCYQQILGDYVYRYPKGSNTILCESCCQRKINQDNNSGNNSLKPITLSETLLPSPTNQANNNNNSNSPKPIELKDFSKPTIVEEALNKIKRGEYVDIDSLKTSDDLKESLKNFQKEWQEEQSKSFWLKTKGKVIIGLGILLGIVLIVVFLRKHRKKTRIKKLQK